MMHRTVFGAMVLVGVVGSLLVESVADDPGQRLYEKHCGQCHGTEGRGGRAPRLVPFEWSAERTRDMIRNPDCDMPRIPPSQVTDAEVEQLVSYLKTIK